MRPIWCQAPDGSLLELHRADLVLMSYESMRDELNVARGWGAAGDTSCLGESVVLRCVQE